MRVWDAETGEYLEVIEGNGDIQVIAAGSVSSPYRLIDRDLDTIVETATTDEPVALFPVALSKITTHPSGCKWAAADGNHVYLLELVGDATTANERGG